TVSNTTFGTGVSLTNQVYGVNSSQSNGFFLFSPNTAVGSYTFVFNIQPGQTLTFTCTYLVNNGQSLFERVNVLISVTAKATSTSSSSSSSTSGSIRSSSSSPVLGLSSRS